MHSLHYQPLGRICQTFSIERRLFISLFILLATPGYWTFTATTSPECNTALCTCSVCVIYIFIIKWDRARSFRGQRHNLIVIIFTMSGRRDHYLCTQRLCWLAQKRVSLINAAFTASNSVQQLISIGCHNDNFAKPFYIFALKLPLYTGKIITVTHTIWKTIILDQFTRRSFPITCHPISEYKTLQDPLFIVYDIPYKA